MPIIKRRGWEISEAKVTPEHLVMRRRSLMAGTVGAIVAPALIPTPAMAQGAPRNPKYTAGRDLTAEADATTYNNFYEFGTDKSIYRAAQRLVTSPWSISIEGLVTKPRKIDLEDLLKQMPIEERIYRHRCVEGWAMTVPWTGFPLSALVKLVEPSSSAKFIAFETQADPKTMPGLRDSAFDWPYVEGVTIDEAMNDVSFMVTGMYGKTLPKQDGAPIRLALPWKYGFKSAKSIVKITFTDKRPETFWEGLQPSEYGFWANVNPAVPHPRWSQATERLIGSDERVPTQIYNGYGEFVAQLYSGLGNEKLFM
jgi:sulfoxide reductase catalytic subunit YedY